MESKNKDVYYMSVENEEYLNHGPYSTKEEADLDAINIRKHLLEKDGDCPNFYTVCKIVPCKEGVIEESKELPKMLVEFIDDWINDNSVCGTEDGVVEIQDSAINIIEKALLEVLNNHTIYVGSGFPTDCIDNSFKDSKYES